MAKGDTQGMKNARIYKSSFTEEIIIDTPQEAYNILTHFCDYCQKDSIGRFHCPYVDAKECEATKNEIKKDWLKAKHDLPFCERPQDGKSTKKLASNGE